MDDDGEGLGIVCWLAVVAGVPHNDEPLAKFVGPGASTCVEKGFSEALSPLVAGFVKEKRLAGGLDGCSGLVMTSGVTTGFVVAEVLLASLLGCWPKTELNGDAEKDVAGSGEVGLTEGFPKLKPVDAEG